MKSCVRKGEPFRGIKVKICGITNLPDALAAQELGADALGFVFYAKSPRRIDPHAAGEIISRLNKKIKKIGVFVNPKAGRVLSLASRCKLDMLQFHGDESPGFCERFKGYKVIKAFRVRGGDNLENVCLYKTDYYMFDGFKEGFYGGTGDRFEWSMLRGLRVYRPFFLCGGLNAGNVVCAIKAARPQWVDASSGVESRPGKKDLRMLEEFIRKVKSI